MIIIPINGKNERMGSLFKTPKHLLEVDGIPALVRTIDYMKRFGTIVILAGENYYDKISVDWLPEDGTIYKVAPTKNVIETIAQLFEKEHVSSDLWIVDCDVVPQKLNKPQGDTVYCFDNEKGPNNYSNYLIEDGKIITCNEKGSKLRHAGAGVYYFRSAVDFVEHSSLCTNVSDVFYDMINGKRTVYGDTTSEILRIGTLPDITGGFTDNQLERTITKTGKTSLCEARWYERYEDKRDVPKVHAVTSDSITMEFIEKTADLNIYKVVELVEKYKDYKPINTLPFEAYIDRIKFHLEGNPIHGGEKLIQRLSEMNLEPTFAHGDLSVINIIPTKTGPRLIDPLYFSNFGSYVLDYAKLLFTLKFYKNDVANFNLLSMHLKIEKMNVLIASECVRVATYNRRFNFIAENLINEL